MTACGDSAGLSSTPNGASSSGTASVAIAQCTFDTAQIRVLLTHAFSASPDQNVVLGKWSHIQYQVNVLNDLATGRQQTFDLVGFILSTNAQQPLTLTGTELASLLNQLFCFVGINANIVDPGETWILPVGNGPTTFVTRDGKTGIQFPSNAVPENTVVTVSPGTGADLTTLLDKYPLVFNWKLSSALNPGKEATVGVCPSIDPLLYQGLSDVEIQALLDRLVLGHQRDVAGFEVLGRTPIPAEMVLTCGAIGSSSASIPATWGGRILNTLANLVLPKQLAAASRAALSGGVGGSTSEFSPFGPVDPLLSASGGVGGSTSEFIRVGPSLLATPSTADVTISGTVGRNMTSALPVVTVRTRNGTAIPGVSVDLTTAPSTKAPYSAAPGNALVCGVNDVIATTGTTKADGTAAVTCLNFGTTQQFRTAYTKLTAAFTPPTGLDPAVIRFVPNDPSWLIASYGASKLRFTNPPAGRTGANAYSADATIPATVEIRSDLDEIVPIATNPVTLSLNQNSFMGAVSTVTANAVNGIATFSTRITKPAAGYLFTGSAALSSLGTVSSIDGSNLFDVAAGAASKIAVIGTTDFGTVATNPVTPSPKVLVTDAYDNPKAGATVFWTPGGATGAQANGLSAQSTNTTDANGNTTASWLLGEGDNVLRSSLQAADGGAEVFFTASFDPSYTTINSCSPGGAKDDIAAYFYTVPGPVKNSGLVHSIGMYLSASGAVGQIDQTIGFPMTLVAERKIKNSAGATVTESFTSSATAFLRGDNGRSRAADRLVTFGFNIPPVPDANLVVDNTQPDLTVRFVLPTGGYGRRINFNAGPCSPGKCNPPPGCTVSEFQMPLTNTTVYRKSVGLVLKGK